MNANQKIAAVAHLQAQQYSAQQFIVQLKAFCKACRNAGDAIEANDVEKLHEILIEYSDLSGRLEDHGTGFSSLHKAWICNVKHYLGEEEFSRMLNNIQSRENAEASRVESIVNQANSSREPMGF